LTKLGLALESIAEAEGALSAESGKVPALDATD